MTSFMVFLNMCHLTVMLLDLSGNDTVQDSGVKHSFDWRLETLR